jgi:SAM-dependent methyltransferase
MPSPDDDVVAGNAAYWEALAPHRQGEPIDFFRDGGSALTDAELAVAGDVAGRRVLQLACAVGDEAISFARLGADVTAVDLAPSHLATGRAKAAALGLSIDFIERDMMRLDELTGFDVIFISAGGICWVPDIDAWAADLSRRLLPGGVLVINEHHPLWEVLSVAGLGRLDVTSDYLSPARDGYPDPLKAPTVTREQNFDTVAPRSFVWSIGRVVSALVRAGLVIRMLVEEADEDLYPGLGSTAARLPATYLLVAARPEH